MIKNKISKEIRSVKIIKREYRKGSKIVNELIESEVSTLADLDNPYIIRILEVYQDDFKYYIVTEPLTGTSLMNYILNLRKKTLNEKIISRYIRQILSALQFCHLKKVVHRDIKPENIIFVDKHYRFLKLTDFKFSKITGKSSDKYRNLFSTLAYLAPEVVSGGEYIDKSDIWSCGIICYLLLSGTMPYETAKDMPLSDLFSIIKNNRFTKDNFCEGPWLDITLQAKEFLVRLLEIDPEKRASAEDLLKDPWLYQSNTTPIDHDDKSSYLLNIKNSIVNL